MCLSEYFLARRSSNLRRCSVVDDSVKVSIDQWVWVSLSTNTGEPAMEEAGCFEHFPNLRITPIVRSVLWENFDLEIVVASRKISWDSEDVFKIDAHEILPGFLESIIKRLLILISFSLTIGDQAITVSDKDEDSSFIGSIQSRYISDWIRVHKK